MYIVLTLNFWILCKYVKKSNGNFDLSKFRCIAKFSASISKRNCKIFAVYFAVNCRIIKFRRAIWMDQSPGKLSLNFLFVYCSTWLGDISNSLSNSASDHFLPSDYPNGRERSLIAMVAVSRQLLTRRSDETIARNYRYLEVLFPVRQILRLRKPTKNLRFVRGVVWTFRSTKGNLLASLLDSVIFSS